MSRARKSGWADSPEPGADLALRLPQRFSGQVRKKVQDRAILPSRRGYPAQERRPASRSEDWPRDGDEVRERPHGPIRGSGRKYRRDDMAEVAGWPTEPPRKHPRVSTPARSRRDEVPSKRSTCMGSRVCKNDQLRDHERGCSRSRKAGVHVCEDRPRWSRPERWRRKRPAFAETEYPREQSSHHMQHLHGCEIYISAATSESRRADRRLRQQSCPE